MATTTSAEIDVERILVNPDQPRKTFDEEALKELAASIKEHGLIQAIAVEDSGNGWYTLQDGERRWRAARMAGLNAIPATVSPASEDGQGRRLARALAANLQRVNLNDLEEARAFQAMKELGLTDAAIAKAVSKSRSYVTNKRGLLELPEQLHGALATGEISERQAMALRPLFALPKPLLEAAEHTWNKPSDLLKKVPEDSGEIREKIRRIVVDNSRPLSDYPFTGDEFEPDGVVAAKCMECPIIVRHGKGDELRCPDEACRKRKGEMWASLQLAAASQATGIPVLAGDHHYDAVDYFYGDLAHLKTIMEKGCENLRLRYEQYGSGNLAGHDHVSVLCLHGKGNHCTCLARLKGQATRNDPGHIAERERDKEIAALVGQAAAAVQVALAAGNAGVWRVIARRYVDYHGDKKLDGWDLGQLQARIARGLVEENLTWNAKHNSADVARNEIKAFLDKVGVELPDDPLGDVRRRLARIQGWIEDLDEQVPTLDQVRGNLDNLQKIAADLDGDAMPATDFAELAKELERASNTLSDLYHLMLNPWFDAAGIDSVSWLLTTPVGDVNFDNALKAASASLVSYTLALLPEENNANKRKVLERRLRALMKGGDKGAAEIAHA